MALTQSHYRFGINELLESSHGWHAAEDTNPNGGVIALDTTFLLRFTLQADASGTNNIDAEFQYRKNGGTWTQITTSTTNVKAVAAVPFNEGDHTTKRLSGTGTFETTSAGCTEDGISGGTAFDIVASGNGETECSLQLVSADLVPGDLIEFRLTRDAGTLIDTYSVTPALLVPGGAITGTVGTSALGALAVAIAIGLSGVAATGAGGSLSASVSQPLTGVSATGSPGTLAPDVSVPLSGVAATGSAGTLEAPTATHPVGVITQLSPGGVPGQRYSSFARGGGDVSLALTGVSATGSVGTLTPVLEVALSGLASAGSPGTLVPAVDVSLSGVSASGSAGILTPTLTVALSGLSATGAVDTLTPSTEFLTALTGVESPGSVGTLAPSLTIALSGLSASGTIGTLTAGHEVAHALTGVSGTSAQGDLSLSVLIDLAGVSAVGEVGTVTPVTGAIAALTGVAASGSLGVVDVIASGSAVLSGVTSTGSVGTLAAIGGDVTPPLAGGGGGRIRPLLVRPAPPEIRARIFVHLPLPAFEAQVAVTAADVQALFAEDLVLAVPVLELHLAGSPVEVAASVSGDLPPLAWAMTASVTSRNKRV